MFSRFFSASKHGHKIVQSSFRRFGSNNYFSSNQSKFLLGAGATAGTYEYVKSTNSANDGNVNYNKNNSKDNYNKNNTSNKNNNSGKNLPNLDDLSQMAQSAKDKLFGGEKFNINSIISQFYDINNNDEIVQYSKKIIDDAHLNFKNAIILDLGVNNRGVFAPILIDKMGSNNGKIISLDLNSHKNLNLPSLKGNVDAIILSNAFHYRDDSEQILQQINQYLKNNGKLIVVDIKEGHFHLPSFVENIMNEYSGQNNDNNDDNNNNKKSIIKDGAKNVMKKVIDSTSSKDNNSKQDNKDNKNTKQNFGANQTQNNKEVKAPKEGKNVNKKDQNDKELKKSNAQLQNQNQKQSQNKDKDQDHDKHNKDKSSKDNNNKQQQQKHQQQSDKNSNNNNKNKDKNNNNNNKSSSIKDQLNSVIEKIENDSNIDSELLSKVKNALNLLMSDSDNIDISGNIGSFMEEIKSQMKNLTSLISKETKIPKNMVNKIEQNIEKMLTNIENYVKDNDIHSIHDIISVIEEEVKNLLNTLQKEIKDSKVFDSVKNVIEQSQSKLTDLYKNIDNDSSDSGKIMKAIKSQMLEIMMGNNDEDVKTKIQEQISSLISNINNYDKNDMLDMVKKSFNQLLTMMETKANKSDMENLRKQVNTLINDMEKNKDNEDINEDIKKMVLNTLPNVINTDHRFIIGSIKNYMVKRELKKLISHLENGRTDKAIDETKSMIEKLLTAMENNPDYHLVTMVRPYIDSMLNNINGKDVSKVIDKSKQQIEKAMSTITDDNGNINSDHLIDEFMDEINSLMSNTKSIKQNSKEIVSKAMKQIETLMNSFGIENLGESGNEVYEQVKEQINGILSNMSNNDNKDIIKQVQKGLKEMMPSILDNKNDNKNKKNKNTNDDNDDNNMSGTIKELQQWIQQHISSFDSSTCKQNIEAQGFVFEKQLMGDDLQDHFVYVFKKGKK